MSTGKTGNCENHKKVMLATNPTAKQAIYFYPRCKMWSCPHCAKKNAAMWAYRLRDNAASLVDSGYTLWFVTVTSHERLTNLAQTLWVWPQSWKKLQARVRYANIEFIYAAIPEQHVKGSRLHFHLITNVGWEAVQSKKTGDWYSKKWRDNARACGLGYKIDVKPIEDVDEVISYVCKYMAKDLGKNEWPDGFRRARLSRSWPKRKPVNLPDWNFSTIEPEDIDFSSRQLARSGYALEMNGDILIFESDDAWGVIDRIENSGMA